MKQQKVKLNRGWELTTYTDTKAKYLACDTRLNTFIHAQTIELSVNTKCGKAWLNFKSDNKQIASIWLTTKIAVKRVHDLIEEMKP